MSDDHDLQSQLESLVRTATVEAFGPELADVDPLVRRSDRADFQADLALGLAKRTKKPPRAVAEAIVAKIDTASSPLLEGIEIAGPGFLNLTLRATFLGETCARVLADARLGVPEASLKDTVVIDYSSPNVAKEMHVGHLRSTVIGDALARLLEHRGHRVVRQNHLGDWGTPFGMLIEHLHDLGSEQAESDLAVGELSAFYKAARAKFDADPAFAERSRKRVVMLQAGDETTLASWQVLVTLSKRYFESVYEKLDVTMRTGDACGESFYNGKLAPLCDELAKGGKATISEGALCLFPAGYTNKEGEPLPLIVRKTDGGFGYATTDLAAIRYRLDELGGTRLLYVVGAPQAQHLGMVFQAAKELGWLAPPKRAEHVAFGSVLGTDKRMYKTRSGETVRLVDLIDAAIERALAVLAEKAPELDAETRDDIAKMVGIGSIKYADLSSDRVKDYVFDLDRMVSFDGNTAGYLQYAYARVRSVFRKAGFDGGKGPILVAEKEERALALALLAFPSAIRAVETTLEPHKLTGYLYGLAMTFTSFYEKCPILKSEGATRESRLSLADLTARTLAEGLRLLGIRVPEKM
jgi:arginyl-tRNA synthetase